MITDHIHPTLIVIFWRSNNSALKHPIDNGILHGSTTTEVEEIALVALTSMEKMPDLQDGPNGVAEHCATGQLYLFDAR